MFAVNRITEPTWPPWAALSSHPGAVVPDMPTMIRWPSSFVGELGTGASDGWPLTALVVAGRDTDGA
jgi:hypothetical protein